MVVLQAGYPKSGNLWLYRIIEHSLDAHGIPRRSFFQNQPIYAEALARPTHFVGQAGVDTLLIRPEGCFYKIANAKTRFPIDNMANYLGQCRHVWTHSPMCERSLEVLPHFDKVVYILRDGRDEALSFAHFVFSPERLAVQPNANSGYATPEAFLAACLEERLRAWVNHVGGYLQHRSRLNVHVLFYERLRYAFDDELDALLAYLGLDLNAQARAALKQAVDFSTMQRAEGSHVRKGKTGEWRTVFTAAQKRRAQEIAGPMLRLLNYPVDEYGALEATHLPSLPANLTFNQIQKAMNAAQPTRVAPSPLRSFVQKLRRCLWRRA